MFQSKANGSIVLGTKEAHAGLTAVESSILPTTDTAQGAIARSVPSDGRGTWRTWIWLQQITPSNPIKLVEVSFINEEDTASAVSLQLTSTGLELVVESGEAFDVVAPKPGTFESWVEVVFSFDFHTNVQVLLGLAQAGPTAPVAAWYDDTTFVPTAH